MCLQRYLVAVGGMALQQPWHEQLDQALGAEDTALLEQKGVLEPAIPQLSSIRREAGTVAKGGGQDWWERKRGTEGNLKSRHNYTIDYWDFFFLLTNFY